MSYIARLLDITVSFINFRNYYKKNYKVIALKPWRDSHLPSPFFNENGELINHIASTKTSLKPYMQVLLSRIPLAAPVFNIIKQYAMKGIGRSRALFDKDLIVCKDRGNTFCAILHNR
jgi:hypothetical protein